MVDTVNTTVIFESDNKYVVQLSNISDGTGETDVVKVDVSTLTGPDGVNAPDTVSIDEITWDTSGMSYVLLEWDATANDEAIVLQGSNATDFRFAGGLRNPKSTGYTGDLLLSTVGAAAAGTYNIVIVLKKRA
jgi:hypothetical protein